MSQPRKSQLGTPVDDPELDALVASKVSGNTLSDDEFRRQKVSFVYGNSAHDSNTTRESAARAVESPLLFSLR